MRGQRVKTVEEETIQIRELGKQARKKVFSQKRFGASISATTN